MQRVDEVPFTPAPALPDPVSEQTRTTASPKERPARGERPLGTAPQVRFPSDTRLEVSCECHSTPLPPCAGTKAWQRDSPSARGAPRCSGLSASRPLPRTHSRGVATAPRAVGLAAAKAGAYEPVAGSRRLQQGRTLTAAPCWRGQRSRCGSLRVRRRDKPRQRQRRAAQPSPAPCPRHPGPGGAGPGAREGRGHAPGGRGPALARAEAGAVAILVSLPPSERAEAAVAAVPPGPCVRGRPGGCGAEERGPGLGPGRSAADTVSGAGAAAAQSREGVGLAGPPRPHLPRRPGRGACGGPDSRAWAGPGRPAPGGSGSGRVRRPAGPRGASPQPGPRLGIGPGASLRGGIPDSWAFALQAFGKSLTAGLGSTGSLAKEGRWDLTMGRVDQEAGKRWKPRGFCPGGCTQAGGIPPACRSWWW